MSRIGNSPVVIKDGVQVSVEGNMVTVKGPKGELKQEFDPAYVSVKVEEGVLTVSPVDKSKTSRSRHGLYRSLINNMVEGVTEGFSKTLEINGVGYRAAMKGNVLEMQLGYSHPVLFDIPQELTLQFEEKSQNVFTISGIDKQLVGQVAANIRAKRKPEPYKGKGIKYIDERVARKAGKSAKK